MFCVVTLCGLVDFGGMLVTAYRATWHDNSDHAQHFQGLHSENGGTTFLQNIGNHLQDHTTSQPIRL